ncbi:MAG: divergent polysaccharide deacetylase family protein [Alphaproteobacteria bacterium]|nr:divergent polysaccharide deacetylase family protein [Alphaproteobacteria bacterium]
MLRLKPIRRRKRRGPSRDVLRVADGAFWLALVFAGLIGARHLLSPSPPVAARASVELSVPAATKATPGATASSAATATPVAAAHGAAAAPPPHPIIAIVIDDLGADAVHTRRAIALPRQVALAFLPDPPDTPGLARMAAREGHEVLLHMPMQAVTETRLGPLALTLDLPPDEIGRRLDRALARVPGRIGVNNHEGSRFTADRAALDPVMQHLAPRHLFFLDSRTTVDTQVVAAARARGVQTGSRDVFLDDVVTIDGVDAQLRVLEAKARAQGAAIAIGHPHEITLDAVAYWTAHEKGFALVTLRAAMRRKTEDSLTLATR